MKPLWKALRCLRTMESIGRLSKVNSRCKNCCTETIKLKAMNIIGYENSFEFSIVPSRLNEPFF